MWRKRAALHVVVGDFDHQLGTQRLPRQILALAPAALAARHALPGRHPPVLLRPRFPRMIGERVLAIGREKLHELAALLCGEARADADVLQRAGIVEETEQQRADCGALAFLVPAEAGDDAVAIALVLHLEHHALVRLVGAGTRLGHDAVETGALEAAEPIRGDARIRASPV